MRSTSFLFFSLLTSLMCFSAEAQLECPNNHCETHMSLVSKELLTGPFSCDKKAVQAICKNTVAIYVTDVANFRSNIYCKVLPSGACPDMETCYKEQFKQDKDTATEEALAILKKNKITQKNFSSLKKLTKDDAKKVA